VIRVALMLIACAMIGCVSRHTPYGMVRDTLAQLPDGGEIYAEWEYEGDPPCTRGPVVMWQGPAHQPKRLITLMPTTGSPTSPADRLPDEPLTNTKRHDVGNGRRVWLESTGGRAIASFDYDAGIAVIGPYGQPTWARTDARPLPGE
jgi:hypothetical protein